MTRYNYGETTLPYLITAFPSAFPIIMSTTSTLGHHTANHSRLNLHRKNTYHTLTTGEWFAPDDQMIEIARGINQGLHNYKDVINRLAFPAYKVDTAGLRKDIGWLEPTEKMTPEFLEMIHTEKNYGVTLTEEALAPVKEAVPLIADSAQAATLYHTFNRTLIFVKERRGASQAVYGYRLWSWGENYHTDELAAKTYEGLKDWTKPKPC